MTFLVIWFMFRQFCEFWQFKELDSMILICLFKLEIFYCSLILIFTFNTIKEANWFVFIIVNFALQAHVFVHKLSKWARYHAVGFRQKKKLKHPGYLLFYSLSIIISVGKQYLYDTLCSLTFSADFKNPGSLSFYCWSIEEIQILPLVKKGKLNLD